MRNTIERIIYNKMESKDFGESMCNETKLKVLRWIIQQLKQHGVMQAEGSDGAKGAAVGQRSVGTNAEAVAFNCVSSESLVYNRPCKEWCGNPYCKSEAPSGGHL